MRKNFLLVFLMVFVGLNGFLIYDYIVKSKELGVSFWRENEAEDVPKKIKITEGYEPETVKVDGNKIERFGYTYETPLSIKDSLFIVSDYLRNEGKEGVSSTIYHQMEDVNLVRSSWSEKNELTGKRVNYVGTYFTVNRFTGKVKKFEGELPF